MERWTWNDVAVNHMNSRVGTAAFWDLDVSMFEPMCFAQVEEHEFQYDTF